MTTARGASCGGGSSSTILKEPVPARPTGGAASVHPCWGPAPRSSSLPASGLARRAGEGGQFNRLVEPDQVRMRARRHVAKAGGQYDRQVRLLGFDALGQNATPVAHQQAQVRPPRKLGSLGSNLAL
ncbi:hypothetical protein [Microvirga tunisiensis]|uniref:Uncharacterized protein n=1 Tax=Microvirga tunisiensis TaxID=2108360 RepID=A0A5N7MW71_9HYPH|nr:hypothetical protein [Microvirga tunisiensis]MPR12798.1 hypothetical protein [Microvirga tunisiensis]MPR30729.1 hypothetical protein [Microvirga tunisiensis]